MFTDFDRQTDKQCTGGW